MVLRKTGNKFKANGRRCKRNFHEFTRKYWMSLLIYKLFRFQWCKVNLHEFTKTQIQSNFLKTRHYLLHSYHGPITHFILSCVIALAFCKIRFSCLKVSSTVFFHVFRGLPQLSTDTNTRTLFL